MATEAEMIDRVQVIGALLTGYAARHHWENDDYRIFYNMNLDWDRVHIVFVARQFDGRDNYQCYQEVWHYLYQQLRRQPFQVDLMESLNLVIAGMEEVSKGGAHEVGPGYRDFWRDFAYDRQRILGLTTSADR
jgi:hypothetical protein